MKLTYYQYYFTQTGHNYHESIFNLLEIFSKVKDFAFKESFKSPSGDQIFLFHISGRVFMLAVIKDDELVKAINKTEMTQADIHERLFSDESLGFASYIYVGDLFYGIASTFYGPRNSVFEGFVNDIVTKITGLDIIKFKTEAFPTSITKEQAQQLKFTSTTSIRLNFRHPYFQAIREQFGLSDDAQKIDFIIKPEARGELKSSIKGLVETLQLEDGLEKFVIRGKAELDDMVTDHYLIGTGHISDYINDKNEEKICYLISKKAGSNRSLLEAINEVKNDTKYSKHSLKAVLDLGKRDNWPSNLF